MSELDNCSNKVPCALCQDTKCSTIVHTRILSSQTKHQ